MKIIIKEYTTYLIGSSNHLTGFYKITVFTKRHFKANFDSDLFVMDFKQNQYINRGDYIKINKTSKNLLGEKAIALRKMFFIILLAIIKTCCRSHVREQNHLSSAFK